jgi:hypothetical protein
MEYSNWLMHWKSIRCEWDQILSVCICRGSLQQTLTTLSLSANRIGKDGIQYLALALKMNQVKSSCVQISVPTRMILPIDTHQTRSWKKLDRRWCNTLSGWYPTNQSGANEMRSSGCVFIEVLSNRHSHHCSLVETESERMVHDIWLMHWVSIRLDPDLFEYSYQQEEFRQ